MHSIFFARSQNFPKTKNGVYHGPLIGWGGGCRCPQLILKMSVSHQSSGQIWHLPSVSSTWKETSQKPKTSLVSHEFLTPEY